MRRYYVVFLASFAIFLAFLTPNVTTGDAGELITAAYFLGTAHPSGYPLYLMLAKVFSFIPFGNIAFRVALVSAFFSSLSITLIYRYVFLLTADNIAGIFSAGLLLTSYSYLTQSAIVKFYPLNLFLILTLFSVWFIQLQFRNTKPSLTPAKACYLTSFILGLSIANHHTGLLMLGPVIIAMFMLRNSYGSFMPRGLSVWSFVLTMIALFISGFIINLYLLARGGEHPFNVFYVRDLKEFFAMISRQAYGEGGTVNIAGNAAVNAFSGWPAYWYGLKNFIFILGINFSPFSFPLFFSGGFYLSRKSYKLLVFFITGLVVYGPFLAGLALSSPAISHLNYYVVAHQYFLPAFAIYVMITGVGFFQVMLWLRIPQYKNLHKIMLPLAIAVFFTGNLYLRAVDSNYRTNHVPYQTAKDAASILPVNSIFLAFGDNERFQGRYLKLVGRYREDTCHLNAVTLQTTVKGFAGCEESSYGSLSPELFRREFVNLRPFIAGERFYSDADTEASEGFPLEEYIKLKRFSMVQELMLKNDNSRHVSQGGGAVSGRLPLADKLINNSVCFSLQTDDLFTRYLCDKYTAHFLEVIKFYTSEKQRRGISKGLIIE